VKAAQSKAEVYLMALKSLSKEERKAVITRLLEDESIREDILDIALIQQRAGEPVRPFREYLAVREKGVANLGYEVRIVNSAEKELDSLSSLIYNPYS
jgi:hypothetical protein